MPAAGRDHQPTTMALHFVLLTIGGLLLVGLLTDQIGRRTHLPRVPLLILFGVALGPSGFDLLSAAVEEWYEFLASTALTMVAFLLGGRLSLARLRSHGRQILLISLLVVVTTVVLVGGGLLALGAPLALALLLAGISTATAPAAIRDVVRQTRARGPFTDTLLGIVAIDDAWGVILFGLILIGIKAMAGTGLEPLLRHALWELGGSIAIGAAVGLPAAWLTGWLRAGEPTQIEALGLVFICAGLAIWAGASFLLAGMVAGAIVVNLASHHRRPFHEIEHIEWPFMVLFFVLAGASLEVERFGDLGLVGGGYIVLRCMARLLGGWLGGRWSGLSGPARRWIGAALLPQAGVAVGMALVAGNHFPEIAETIVAVTIGSTVVFELAGPALTQAALLRTGEMGGEKPRGAGPR